MRRSRRLTVRAFIIVVSAVALLAVLGGGALGATQHAGPWMIFAFDDSTRDDQITNNGHVQVSGSNNDLFGDIWSNGDFNASGSGNVFGEVSGSNGIVRYYDFTVNGSNTYNEGLPSQVASPAATYPGTLAAFDVPECDPLLGSFTDDTDLTLTNASDDGTYCRRDGKIVISDSNVTGSFTLLTQPTVVGKGLIEISGGNATLTPFADGVLAYTTSTSDSAIEWKGSDGDGTGLFFAPNGRIDMEGSDGEFCMQYAALVVTIQGSDNVFEDCSFEETTTTTTTTTTTDTTTTTTTTDTTTTVSDTTTTTTDTTTTTTDTTVSDTTTTTTDTTVSDTTTTTTDTSTAVSDTSTTTGTVPAPTPTPFNGAVGSGVAPLATRPVDLASMALLFSGLLMILWGVEPWRRRAK